MELCRKMPIETDFAFAQRIAHIAARAAAPTDLLGLLRGLVGTDPPPPNNPQRKWTGKGFNMIWRPNHGGQSGPEDFFLELNFTDETLEFLDITGAGIANRGLLQNDIPLGGVAYMQTIRDSFDGSGQHFEPGVWANVPATTHPNEQETIVRIGSIPHGTTINLQGRAFSAPQPQFAAVSIKPFPNGQPNNPIDFPAQNLSIPSQSRTPLNQVAALTQLQLNDPNLFLSEAIGHRLFSKQRCSSSRPTPASRGRYRTRAEVRLTSRSLLASARPPAGGPNALAASVEATFWIERVRGEDGNPDFNQLQYTQCVLLNFKELSWPHITVATLREG